MLTTDDIERFLRSASEPPAGDTDFVEWVECHSGLSFLANSVSGNVPIYISGPAFFLYGVMVPSSRLAGEYGMDLMAWNFSPSSGWGYGVEYETVGSERIEKPTLFPPLDHTGTSTLENAEPVLFLRHFEGYKGDFPASN